MDTRSQVLNRVLNPVGLAVIAAFALNGCTGLAGEGSEAGEGGDEVGFDYGASQEEVDAALEDLEPVTLNYQVVSPSPDAQNAQAPLAFKESVEERSDGKITIDLV